MRTQRERLRLCLRDIGFGYVRATRCNLKFGICHLKSSEAWLDAVTNDPLLPGRILPSDYLGQQAWRV